MKRNSLTAAAGTEGCRPVELGPHSGPLRLVAFSDYGVQDIGLLIEELSKLAPPADLVLYGGDDIARFRPSESHNLFEDIARCSRHGLCAVVGNNEQPTVRGCLSGNSVFNVHAAPVILGDHGVLGVEGEPSRGHSYVFQDGKFLLNEVMHSEGEISRHLALQKGAVGQKTLIIVSHTPPAGVLDKAVRFSRDGKPRSIGSRALNKFVRRNKCVILVVCGHAHLSGGANRPLKHAMVVNASNHDHFGEIGRFAVVDVGPGHKITVQWREIREVSSVPGIGPITAERLRQIGIRTAQELADLFPESLACVPSLARPPEVLQARALAQVEKRPIFLRPLQLPSGTEIFLDIETDPDGGEKYVWLVGFCVGRDGPYTSFFAKTPANEKVILVEFLRFVGRHPNANLLTFSGCRFEERILGERLSAHGLDASISSRVLDLSPMIWQSVALPIESEELKDAARAFGFRFRHPELNGFRVASLYQDQYVRLRHPTRRRKLRRKFLTYNEDDVRSLPFILEAVENLARAADTE